MRRTVLVAVDEQPVSRKAVRWAAGHAARHRLHLRLVYTHPWPVLDGVVPLDAVRDQVERAARSVLADTAAVARAVAPGLAVDAEADLRHGAEEALLRRAEGAELVVLGSAARSRLASLLTGDPATGTVRHAPCPVVVVHPERAGAPDGPVVVGVDGSALSERAVEHAVAEAVAADAPLLAVHAWLLPQVGGPELAAYGAVDETEHRRAHDVHAALLAESLAGWADKHPDLRVEQRVLEDHTGHALVAASRGARLVVVGSRGRGGFRGLLLGSVSSAVVHHADCPVMVCHR